MYNLNSYNFGAYLRTARKSKKMSAIDLGKAINKTDATIYKYERGVLMPDINTVLEICNALDIGFDDLTTTVNVEETQSNSFNPFGVDKLYLYYLGFNNKILLFELELKLEGGFQRVYFKNVNQILFVGTLESSHDIAYITMKNYATVNKKFEKVELILNLKYSSDNRYMGLINGTDDITNEPLTKKCLVSTKLIDTTKDSEIKELKSRLSLKDKELQGLKDKNCWNMDVSNKNDFNVI